jgi:transposase-like protein
VWSYLRFTLSFRDAEDVLAERGIEVSYESVRRWVLKFGPAIARNLRRLRPRPSPRWHGHRRYLAASEFGGGPKRKPRLIAELASPPAYAIAAT